MNIRFFAVCALVVCCALYVGYRLGFQQSRFDLPFVIGQSGELQARGEFVPLDRLGLKSGAQLLESTGSHDFNPGRENGRNDTSGQIFVRLRCAHPGETGPPIDLIVASAPQFPHLELDDGLMITKSPLGQLNEGRRLDSDASEPTRELEESSWRQEFLVGARLLAVEGTPVSSLKNYETIYDNHRDFVLIRYTLLPQGASEPVEFVVWKVDWHRAALIYVSGLAFALLGLVVIYLQPATYSARGFLFFALSLGVFSMFRAIPPLYRNSFEWWTFSLLISAMPIACGMFLVTFSPLRLIFRQTRKIAWILAAWGLGIWLANQATHPGLNRFGPGTPFMLWALTMLAFVIAPLPADYIIRWRGFPLGAMDRQRGETIRFATLLAFLPIVVQTIYQEITKNSGWVFTDLCTLLFPAIIAFAVLRRGLLVVDEVLLHSLVLLLLFAVVGLSYSGMMAISAYLAPRVEFLDSGMFNGFLLGLLTFSAGGIQIASRRWVSERLNRLPPEFGKIVSEPEEEAVTLIDPVTYCKGLGQSIAEITGGATVQVYICTPGKPGRWWLASKVEGPQRGPHSDVIAPALNLAFAEKTMIARDAILDDLNHAANRTILAHAFREMHASLLFPLVYEPEVWGVLAVGDRPNLKPFRRSEHGAFKRVAEQAAVRIRNAYRRIKTSKSSRSGPRIAEMAPGYPPHIGAYRIDRFLDKGGMALVFRGWRDGRPYALKVPNLAVQNDARMMNRFAREARTLCRLRHPSIITVDEVGDENGEPWIAMEYLPMGTISAHLKKEGPIEEELARSLTRQVALGLAAAQAEDVIHRDIKPNNIFFISSDTVKVGDFGLAKVADMTTLTTISKLMGTPGYIAPEIWESKGADWASDQYALGVTFYEMLAGERPYKADSVVRNMTSHLFLHPPDIRDQREDVSVNTSNILIRMLAKNPDDRFSSYAELVAALS